MTHRIRITRLAGLACVAGLALTGAACGDDDPPTAAGDGPSVSFVSPADGATVTSPVQLEMQASGITVEPAGEVREGAGHFHVMVDEGCVEPGETIPANTEGFNHFGKAQTEAELELPPGEHTLCLQMGDGAHTALDVTDTITITVE